MSTNSKGQFIREDIGAKRFGTVTLGKDFIKAPNGGTKWPYTCDCGYRGVSWAETFKRQPNFTCPECRKTVLSRRRTTHGHAGKHKSSTYMGWMDMKHRCLNPNHVSYADYGARGITVCERWMNFSNFLEDMGNRPLGLQIERVNNELGYFKENCIWATSREQANNRRSNVYLTFKGKTQTMAQWGRELRICKTLIRQRHLKGWPIGKVLSTERF